MTVEAIDSSKNERIRELGRKHDGSVLSAGVSLLAAGIAVANIVRNPSKLNIVAGITAAAVADICLGNMNDVKDQYVEAGSWQPARVQTGPGNVTQITAGQFERSAQRRAIG
jgi:hypothetical protein